LPKAHVTLFEECQRLQMKMSMSAVVLAAALWHNAQGAHLGDEVHRAEDQMSDVARHSQVLTSVGCPLTAIQDAAHSVVTSAAAEGIALAGCNVHKGLTGTAAAALQVAAARAQKQQAGCSEHQPQPESSEEEEEEEALPCAVPPPPCPPSAASLLAQAAGKKAKALSEAFLKAQNDANKAVAVAKMEKHKVELMKKIIARAYQGAQAEAADIAKAKVGVVSALASVKCEPKQDVNLEKAEKDEADAIKARDALMASAKSGSKKQSAAGCACNAADMACNANNVLDEIDANLAGGNPC
jgi:hypothetical protein